MLFLTLFSPYILGRGDKWGPQPPDSVRTQEERAVHSFKHDGPPSSFVDVRNPLLIQQQFDAEQKQIEREHEGGGDVLKDTTTSVSTSAPQDISPFCDTSLKPPVREKMLPEEKAASSTPSMPGKEKCSRPRWPPCRV